MSESRSKELKRHGKKGANRGETEDGPSNFPLASTPGDDFHDEGVDTGGRVRKRKNIGEEMELQDPFVAFGSEIMVMILKQLDARSVARSRLISRGWHSIASSDEIWSRKMSWKPQRINFWRNRSVFSIPSNWRNTLQGCVFLFSY
ncbi:uncharacterized protein LOC111371589 isoform X1 [Olea europaea var. sylvestris]|uniref:uncharacterized protein LOC111371589 isoform X1 n=1 Tax=Olea europaea var. sylvestris TaxID=158386 RepID=UPI000C1D290F|nr:uncharacterized protein LOC111371589 isoform X1 [Olea europaea var. sylvestris]